jgi:putative transposase
MEAAQIKSVRGYKRPRFKVGKSALVAPDQLQLQFQQVASNTPPWLKVLR